MAMQGIEKVIREGIANAKANPHDYGVEKFGGKAIATRKVQDHPNRTLQLPEMKTFTIGRQTMDKRKGKNGYIVFTMQAVDGPTARRLVDEEVERINEPFIKKMRKDS
jgi:hypothetical protein